jgi:hypothetical protein
VWAFCALALVGISLKRIRLLLEFAAAAAHARCIKGLAFSPVEAQLEQLFQALPSLPSQPPQLSYTSALLVSSYAEWLGKAISAGHCGALLPR